VDRELRRKRGWQSCPAPSIPAGTIEQLVMDQIRQLGPDTVGNFASLWEALPPSEQSRLAHLVVERIDYDGVQASDDYLPPRWQPGPSPGTGQTATGGKHMTPLEPSSVLCRATAAAAVAEQLPVSGGSDHKATGRF
jgi:hypothetical protein